MARLRLTALIALGIFAGWTATAAARGERLVRYHGYTVAVPATWPVYDLAVSPTVCVRFDLHAVYLGEPSSTQQCPAHTVGRTEAILVQPLAAPAASAGSLGATVLPEVIGPGAQPEGGSSTVLRVPRRGVVVTATWAGHPLVIARALGLRRLPATRAAATSVQPARLHAPRAAAVPAGSGAVFTGLGFDACSAPSAAQMSAWSASPYHAIGVYIGGTNMACAQRNLTAGWASSESAGGWHLIPTYVGLQAPGNSCGCASIVPAQAATQGTAAAVDAVNRARLIGIDPGNPIYFDMEAYARSATNTSAVLKFLAAWTSQLHADGYQSGVYSSADSGITDLVAQVGTGFLEPDDLWIARWNAEKSISDPNVPAGDWPNHHRLHQYQGAHDERYGGVTLNIDNNYLDGATAAATFPLPDGTLVQLAGTQQIYRIAGGAPLYVSDWTTVGGVQPYTIVSQQQFAALRSVPADGTFLQTSSGAVYRVAGGAPIQILNLGLFGPQPPAIAIDHWDIANAGNPLAHLNALPVNGTAVEGLPSKTYWVFTQGSRRLTGATPVAIPVDDAGLSPFPVLAPRPPPIRCLVPPILHLSLTQARHALSLAHCSVGRVSRPRHHGRRTLRVVRQSPAARTRHRVGYPVTITLG